MKKRAILFLILGLTLVLTGCGGAAAPSEPVPTEAPVVTQAATTEPATEPTTVPTEPPRVEITKSYDGEPEEPYELYAPDYSRTGYPRIAGQILYDANGIRVTMPDCQLKPDFTGFYSIPLVLENDTDVTVRMFSFDFAINHKAIITTSGGAFSDAEPRSTVQAECIFYQSSINCNARAAALPRDFELVLTFFNGETHERIDSSDVIRFSSDVDPGYTEEVEPYPLVLWEDAGISVRAGRMYQTKRGNVKLELSVENAFDEPLSVTGVDVSINGVPVELKFSRWIIPGATDYEPLEITAKEMDAWGLTYDELSQLSIAFTCTRHYEEEVLMESSLIELDLVPEK